MRRSFVVAAVAALLALLLVPVGVGAATGTLDQQAAPGGGGEYLVDHALTQTFTAGLTGQLTEVDLYCDTGTGLDATEDVSVGAATTTGTCLASTPNWVAFVFANPPSVVAGQQYTITFGSTTPTAWWESPDSYAGGTGADPGNPDLNVDFAFRTYVLVTSTPPPSGTVASERGSAQEPPAWLLPAWLLSVVASLLVVRRRLAQTR